jgi:DNA-binding NarL/FixJ family response regulator
MDKPKIKVCTFSQQPLFQEGVLRAFSGKEDLQIIGQANVTDQALFTEVMPPDVVIVDIDTLSDSGLNLASRFKQRLPSVGVIVLTSNPSDDQLFLALENQVAAYLSKEINGDHLADTIRSVYRGEYPIRENLSSKPEVAGKILRQFQELAGKREGETLIAPLTTREMEILNYVAQGYSNKQIAVQLNISEQTIKNHVASIMLKLNANARTQAVVIAVQKGLISLDQRQNSPIERYLG